MEKVLVKIEGISPLLQHRFPEEDNPQNKSKKKIKEHSDQADCEKSLYRGEGGDIYQPSTHLLGAMIKAGAQFSFEKKMTYSSVIKSSVFIYPDCIPHIFKNWVMDRRPVVIQRARIMRARPRFDKWALQFEIEFDEDIIGKDKIKEILEYAGTRKGIGDNRPTNGRFIVIKFEAVNGNNHNS